MSKYLVGLILFRLQLNAIKIKINLTFEITIETMAY
jgi:hypothetical protein